MRKSCFQVSKLAVTLTEAQGGSNTSFESTDQTRHGWFTGKEREWKFQERSGQESVLDLHVINYTVFGRNKEGRFGEETPRDSLHL